MRRRRIVVRNGAARLARWPVLPTVVEIALLPFLLLLAVVLSGLARRR